MKMTLTTAIAALAALAWLSPETPAAAQETTIHEALEHLQRAEPNSAPAKRFLRQLEPSPSACRFRVEDRVPDPRGGFTNRCRFDPAPRTAAELDAFADRVAAVAADATLPDDVRWEATAALAGAASADGDGTPYPRARAFDLLVEVYEGGYDHALIHITGDEFPERGPAYMRELFERSERPRLCPRVHPSDAPPGCEGYSFRLDARPKPFCKAGRYLFKKEVAEAWERLSVDDLDEEAAEMWKRSRPTYRRELADWLRLDPHFVPPGLPEHVEDWYRRCHDG